MIELLIMIVVLGLIASLAYPSFLESIRKSRRSEAYAALSELQLKQERWRTNNATYSDSLTSLSMSDTTPNKHYTIAIASSDAQNYEVTATPTSGSSQVKDGDCAKLGVKMVAGNLKYGSASASGSLAYAATNKCWAR